MTSCVLYVHGKGGSAAEAEHYRTLFPECEVVGLDYKTFTPWETGAVIAEAVTALRERFDGVILIANSIGAYFSMCAGIDALIERAYFISPIVDMERLIFDMMSAARVTEAELEVRRTVPTDFGETLSWEYLSYVRAHPVSWRAPAAILYGGRDELTSYETVSAFAEKTGASLTVMKDGEHWFHTAEQMRFLDEWITGDKITWNK